MKKNFLFGLIGAGALILSGSVGFAAWTINAKNDINKDASLGVSADGTVKDNRIKLDETNSKFQTGFDSIAFVPVSNSNITSPWLDANPLESAEKLTIKYDLVVTGGAGLTVSATASIVDEESDTKSKFTSLIDDGIIGALPTDITVSLTEESSSKGTYKGTIEATCTWGTHFTSTKTHTPVNPYTFYNEQDYTDPLADDANTCITRLNDIASYSGLKLRFTVSVK